MFTASKAAGEVAAAAWRKHYTLRTSWAVGAGKNFVGTMASWQSAASTRPWLPTSGRPTFTQDLAAAALHLLFGRGIRHLQRVEHRRGHQLGPSSPGAVYEGTGHDLARVSDTTTEAYFANAELFAHRPTNSAMDLSKLGLPRIHPARSPRGAGPHTWQKWAPNPEDSTLYLLITA